VEEETQSGSYRKLPNDVRPFRQGVAG